MNNKKYSAEISPRQLRFNFTKKIPKYWQNNSAIKTYHFNALALFLPLLEKLVVLSLKKALSQITDPLLKAKVKSLVAQEAIHGREFNRYNQYIIAEHFPLSLQSPPMRAFRIISGIFNKVSPTFHYALSAAGEHFTAIAADLFLREPKWFQGVDPTLTAIWRWHCIEELEHKSVAFDVFKTLNGSYFLRILAMLIMTWVFSTMYIKPIWQMMRQDRKHLKFSFYYQALQYYWGKGGIYRSLIKPYLDYFKPHFHPTCHQNEALITYWKKFFENASLSQIHEALQLSTPPCPEEPLT